jgi:hypothetical protein
MWKKTTVAHFEALLRNILYMAEGHYKLTHSGQSAMIRRTELVTPGTGNRSISYYEYIATFVPLCVCDNMSSR